MPPTIGHLHLIQFANKLTPDGTVVIICTQPSEPFAYERVNALREAVESMPKVTIQHYHKKIEQDPSKKGFWPMWKRLMNEHGATSSDYIVASEPYGQKVADLIGAQFFPYDIDRTIAKTKATRIRQSPNKHFSEILPEFQKSLRTTITVFGAESTGKTTLSKKLATDLEALWLFEYARPYLENTINEITIRSMEAIWRGQYTLQQHANDLEGYSVIVQDTDLFSTVGYWQFPHWRKEIGNCPDRLKLDAIDMKSDLYIVTKSNIPFEPDPLRYGGDKREGDDEYWINICEQYELPYIVLESKDLDSRVKEAKKYVLQLVNKKMSKLSYDRRGL